MEDKKLEEVMSVAPTMFKILNGFERIQKEGNDTLVKSTLCTSIDFCANLLGMGSIELLAELVPNIIEVNEAMEDCGLKFEPEDKINS